MTTSVPFSRARAAAAFGQRGRTLSTSHREAGAAAARGLCKACKLQAGPRMRGHTRRQAMLRAANRPGSARSRAQPRPTRRRLITCFPDFTFQKTIPRRCRLVASVLEDSANLRDPSPSRSINRSTRLEAARRVMSVQVLAKAKQSCNARWAHDSYTCWRSNHLYWYEFAVATRCSRRRGNNKLQRFIEMHTDKRQY